MKKQRIVPFIIVLMALFSFYNTQKILFVSVKNKIQSYRLNKNQQWFWFTVENHNDSHNLSPVTKQHDKGVHLIHFRLE